MNREGGVVVSLTRKKGKIGTLQSIKAKRGGGLGNKDILPRGTRGEKKEKSIVRRKGERRKGTGNFGQKKKNWVYFDAEKRKEEGAFNLEKKGWCRSRGKRSRGKTSLKGRW